MDGESTIVLSLVDLFEFATKDTGKIGCLAPHRMLVNGGKLLQGC